LKWQFNKYLILESEQRQKRQSLKWVIAGGVIVTMMKGAGFLLTNSNAILSDVIESLINLAASSFSLYSLFYASKPRDSRHPYGHGKMEYLAATVEGCFIFLAGSAIAIKAIYNIFYPQPVGGMDTGILFVSAAAIANFGLGYFLVRKSKKLDSLVLESDGKRILSDAYSSAGLIGGLIIIYFTGFKWMDSVIAIFCGLLIVRTGYKIVKQSIKGLLDAADTENLEEVVKVLQENSRSAWIDLQNMRASHHGMYLYIDCHITMPWYWNLRKVDEQVREAEEVVNKYFKERVELFVQADPCQPRHCHICRIEDCPVRQHPFRKRNTWKLKSDANELIPPTSTRIGA
jgi:cation diffusion facilitator family transporter